MKDFDIFYMLGIILIFSSILFLAYIATRYLAGKAGKIANGKHINIIENVTLGKDRYLHLVKVENEFMLIASSGKGVELLSRVTVNNYAESTDNMQSPFSFKSIFEKKINDYMQKNFARSGKDEYKNQNNSENANICLTKFKSNLNKIRTITKKAEIDKEE